MHGHTPGTNTVLLIAITMSYLADQNFSQVSIWHIALYICMYISNISVMRLVVITHIISHSVAGDQGLPSVYAKLTNIIWDASKPFRVCYKPRGDKDKN